MKKNTRKHLTRDEVERMLAVVGECRDLERNACLLWMCFVHGCRVSELTGLRLADLDLVANSLYVRRLKNGLATIQPLHPMERELLMCWLQRRQHYPGAQHYDWLFLSHKGGRLSRSRIHRILKTLGELAGLSVGVHPHMLRHACGYVLADKGADTRLIQDYLGHRNIQHTVLYTASNAGRFKELWRDENVTF
ncbi:tyrosine-type recombinase/integrase [Serratia proteamaculans]|uniref:Tyrosine-type recombinase/integrase n=1 Tax=Serratia proteamaculans TaxID=28151 RepID=A0A5Q2V8V4_SERPR|nr:tyrosine-type recombinase/integrase [Serratia proteamaculans]QGH60614.1 tyrosine-type recombinase/integrase [Serratia proteamaculans]